MVDLNTQVSQIAVEILQNDPQASTKQLIEKLTAALEQNTALQAALKSDERLIQINQGSNTAFQTWVEGGIANIGVHLHGVETQKLIEVVREVLRSVLPVGIAQNLPYSGTTVFVGRETDMAALHQQLGQDERVAVSAISGMGGIGKTELALQYALEHLGLKTYAGGVCWVRAREEVGTQIVSFARSQLSLEPPEDLKLLQKVQWCWRNWQAGEILTVFDDVQAYADVQPYLPPAAEPRFKVLMTTRLSRLATSVQNYEIQVLSEAAALKLLSAIAPDGRIDSQLADAKALCEWVGWLPLGLELVGRYLARKPDLSIAQLLQRLQEKRLDAKALKQAEPGMTATLGVAAAFELSWQELSASAQQLAGLLSLFALAPIAWTLVEACLPEWDAEELEDLRDEALLGRHLLQRSAQEMYQLHQLLREFFAAKRSGMAIEEEMKRSVCRVMVAEAEQVPPTLTIDLIAQYCTPLIPHFAEVATQGWMQYVDDSNYDYVFIGLARFYEAQSFWKDAERWKQEHLYVAQARFGESHPEITNSLNNLAELYQKMGRYSEAESLHQRALTILENQLGYDQFNRFEISLLAAPHFHGLANVYCCQGEYDQETELMYKKALLVWTQELGENNPLVATCLYNLANLYRLQGRHKEAESFCLQSLQIRQKLLSDDHPDTVVSRSLLAQIHDPNEESKYSESEFLRILEQNKCLLGDEHHHVAADLNNLACAYLSQGRYVEAEPYFHQSLELQRRLFGNENQDVAITLYNLSNLYYQIARYDAAESYLTQALEVFEKVYGTNHPKTIDARANLTALRQQRRQSPEKRHPKSEQRPKPKGFKK